VKLNDGLSESEFQGIQCAFVVTFDTNLNSLHLLSSHCF